MQKKKLDELFQEKFVNFKETPDNKVWRSIEASLNKKQKKRIIPIWWTLGGIAAALFIGFLLLNPFVEEKGSESILVDSKKEVIKEEETNANTSIPAKTPTPTQAENQLVETETTDAPTKNAVHPKPMNNGDTDSVIKQGNSVSTNTSLVENNTRINNPSKKNWENPTKEMGLATQTENATQNNASDVNSTEVNTAIANATTNKKDTLPNNNKFNSGNESTAIVATDSENDKEKPDESGKKSIFDEIAQEDLAIAETTSKNRWSAGPSVAPVYFNAIGEGSPVNAIFSPNSKSGNVNLSYGVSVAYQVTEKLSVRSGIHKVDYGYDTNDVRFSSSLASAFNDGQLTNINYASDSKSIIVSSNETISDKYSTANSSSDVTARSATREGFLSQQLGYLELPIELNYALVNNKFGVDLIGGFSSLFLIDNNVSLTSGELTAEVGEANNVNELNFSANMGLGVHYKFTPKVRLNVEPVFKYQLNTFSNVDGSFNPYSIGIYSGITFKF